ncbi:hypothetical protein [Desulfospira joergensenii]|nr:hypothetical protein [Desulfospira joergensenii]
MNTGGSPLGENTGSREKKKKNFLLRLLAWISRGAQRAEKDGSQCRS